MSEHLVRRGARYYYRRRVPTDLIAAFGKKEHQQALGTSDPKEAAVLARKAAVELDAMFARLRAGKDAPVPDKPTLYGGWDAMHPEEFTHPESNLDQQIAEHDRREELRTAIAQAIAGESIVRLVAGTVQEVATHAPESTNETAVGLLDALQMWQKLRTPAGATVTAAHTVVSRFWENVGKLPVKKIQRSHVVTFQDWMIARELQPGTVRSQVALLSAILGAAVEKGVIKTNPALGVKTTGQKHAKTARLPFTVSEINTIFEKLPRTGARYWLPVISLYSGLRLEEIGQLAPEDIKQEHYRDAAGVARKVYVIYATGEGDGQGLKNDASRRRVPVHSTLVELGFIKYVHSQKGARIFPELKPDKNGRETAVFSNWFSVFKRKTCGITDSRKAFHSLRHVFKDGLREVGVTEEVSDALSGHSNGSVSRNYGGGYYPLRPLVEAMSRYEVHGVTVPVRAG